MATRKFTLDELREFGAEYDHVWSEEVDSRRWTRTDEVVFQAPDDQKFYKTYVTTGLTEYQDLDFEDRFPDFEGGFLEAPEVEKTTKTVQVTVWEDVN